MNQSPLTIGHLARAAGINVETVRYYQRIGLIQEPPKPQQGYRYYSSDTVDRLKFIRHAQQLGFSLQQIAELLELGEGHCEDVRVRAEEKREQIDMHIKDLTTLRRALDKLIKSCHSGSDPLHCPIMETLAGKR